MVTTPASYQYVLFDVIAPVHNTFQLNLRICENFRRYLEHSSTAYVLVTKPDGGLFARKLDFRHPFGGLFLKGKHVATVDRLERGLNVATAGT